jgi:hypothetical protein
VDASSPMTAGSQSRSYTYPSIADRSTLAPLPSLHRTSDPPPVSRVTMESAELLSSVSHSGGLSRARGWRNRRTNASIGPEGFRHQRWSVVEFIHRKSLYRWYD